MVNAERVYAQLVAQFYPELLSGTGQTTIHAGHFMLLPTESGCAPSVTTGPNSERAKQDDDSDTGIQSALHTFAISTWRLGVAFASALKNSGRSANLITLVNDWQYLRSKSNPQAIELRKSFYKRNSSIFPAYEAIMREHDIEPSAVMPIGNWQPFVSESWLRRRLERRLKRTLKQPGASDDRLSTETSPTGDKVVVFDDFGRACRLLVCGQSDCAGEVMELIYLLWERGCRQFVNIVPAECEKPVNEGTRRAITVFGLADFSALNIAVPCLAAATWGQPSARSIRVTRVYADDDGGNERCGAVVEPVRWRPVES